MTARILLAVLLALGVACAGDEWARLKAVKSGTELKVKKVGTAQVLEAKMDELTETSLLVATQKEQLSIARDEIEWVQARQEGRKGPAVVSESKKEMERPEQAAAPLPGRRTSPQETQSISNNVVFNRPGFEVVYKKSK